MKKYLFVVVLLISCLQIHAQEIDSIPQNRKIGIKFKSLDHFGLIYKKKLDEKYLRIEALHLGSHISQAVAPDDTRSPQNSYAVDLGFNVGLEKYHTLDERLDFLHGFSFLSGVSFQRNKISGELSSKEFNTNVGIGYIMGVKYTINQTFEVTAGLLPSLRYYFNHKKNYLDNRTNKHYTHSFRFNFSDNARFSILYNF